LGGETARWSSDVAQRLRQDDLSSANINTIETDPGGMNPPAR
jgi:hypothetical protein